VTISARVVADSVSEAGKRLTTLQLRYPKFIHGELMTHRVFSRNASSSRATPVERLIKDVVDDPVYPSHWGKNQPGMQAAEECEEAVEVYGWGGGTERHKRAAWDLARQNAVKASTAFAAAGYHKQIVNRLLEPFCHINVVVTATEWSNFFALRCHEGAQPEMRELAEKMRDAMAASEPRLLKVGEWHRPYVTDEDKDFHRARIGSIDGGFSYTDDALIRISVARCARVSYLTQEGKPPNVEDDLKLYDRLVGAVPLHASPAEHQATPDTRDTRWFGPEGPHHAFNDRVFNWRQPELHGNLVVWCQWRKMLPGECQ
jgi:thymidylate synthase ThyX